MLTIIRASRADSALLVNRRIDPSHDRNSDPDKINAREHTLGLDHNYACDSLGYHIISSTVQLAVTSSLASPPPPILPNPHSNHQSPRWSPSFSPKSTTKVSITTLSPSTWQQVRWQVSSPYPTLTELGPCEASLKFVI